MKVEGSFIHLCIFLLSLYFFVFIKASCSFIRGCPVLLIRLFLFIYRFLLFFCLFVGSKSILFVLEACKALSLDVRTVKGVHCGVIKLGHEGNSYAGSSLILSYIRCSHCHHAKRLFEEGITQKPFFEIDLLGGNLILSGFMKSGEFDIGKKVFSRMRNRDVVSWNSVIGGCVRNSRYSEGIKLFERMIRSKVEPDGFTFASVIAGCARLGGVDQAKRVHNLMIERKVELNFILGSALVDMYSRCGCIEIAEDVFNSIEHSNACVWNAMINGLAVHGHALKAINLFFKMESENVKPDAVTFVGLLKALSYCGFVQEGCEYFDLMRTKYSIQPEIEHYGTMVDLLGRAGLLEDAYDLIESMPMEPDVIMWRTILSACRIYKKPELGEIAISKMSHLNSGDYVLLSNTYCYHNRWGSAQRVRETMKKDGVHKSRGKSWIELSGMIYQFNSGDQSHPEMHEIHKVLEQLTRRTKLEGFVPATELVIMDVSEEEKETSLNCHSEKLALAYGILKTGPGADIRISKNLRTCYDCHRWMKMVSKMVNRVIIVRDRIRFHRFEGGCCSCNDYW